MQNLICQYLTRSHQCVLVQLHRNAPQCTAIHCTYFPVNNAVAMVAVEVRKKAPPEKPEAVSLRTKIVLSFWAVILLLGLPTWYKTTEIYRANLPLQQMIGLSEGEVRLCEALCSLL